MSNRTTDKVIKLTPEDREIIGLFDLTPVTIEDTVGWDGYIDPQGRFYRTKPTDVTEYLGSIRRHKEWADAYCLSKGIDPDDFWGTSWVNAQDHLVNVEGWASCRFRFGHAIYIEVPDYDRSRLTMAQRQTLRRLFEINGYDIAVYLDQCEESNGATYRQELRLTKMRQRRRKFEGD